jgi:hypothetical protein
MIGAITRSLMPMSERCTCARFMHSHAYSLTVRSTLSAIARSLSAVPVGNQIADYLRLSCLGGLADVEHRLAIYAPSLVIDCGQASAVGNDQGRVCTGHRLGCRIGSRRLRLVSVYVQRSDGMLELRNERWRRGGGPAVPATRLGEHASRGLIAS